jgi:hypothetical protein
MKFISKSSNLLIVLRPGFAAQPLTGSPAKPTVSVRFKDGVAEIQQQELIDMMLAHPGFNGDFISVEETKTDPYASLRRSTEPAHVLTEMKYGTPVSRQVVGAGSPISGLSPELQKAVQSLAGEMAKAMLPGMVKSTLEGLVSAHQADKATSDVKSTAPKYGLKKDGKERGRPGRKPKVKATEPVAENSSTQS